LILHPHSAALLFVFWHGLELTLICPATIGAGVKPTGRFLFAPAQNRVGYTGQAGVRNSTMTKMSDVLRRHKDVMGLLQSFFLLSSIFWPKEVVCKKSAENECLRESGSYCRPSWRQL
jgi:hypothetical protein